MKKIEGIKSVDFEIKAEGFGVVNWNGSASLRSPQAGQVVNNHTLPKVRGLDLFKVKSMDDINDNAKLYISQNCIRQAIFKDFTYGLKEVTLSNVEDVLQSMIGLVRGYVIAEGTTSLKRKSALFLEDFVAGDDVKLNYEQFSNQVGKNETSIYSKHTAGKTNYSAYGSINIEDLQFLPLEDSLSRSCYAEVITIEKGEALARKITDYLSNLKDDKSLNKNPQAIFSNNYTRINSIVKTGEAGILLNNDAISLIIKEICELIENLTITRTRAQVDVIKVVWDYNSGRTMRIKRSHEDISSSENESYAIYYEAQPFSAQEFEEKNKEKQNQINADKKKKDTARLEKENKKKAKVETAINTEPENY
jgi:hypothetical protein